MRTTVDLPDDLFREAKTRAVQQGTSLKQLITQFIRSGLRDQAPARVLGSQRALPPAAIARQSDSPRVRPMSNRQLHRLLEEDDLSQSLVESTGL
jgi:hypothetical protein